MILIFPKALSDNMSQGEMRVYRRSTIFYNKAITHLTRDSACSRLPDPFHRHRDRWPTE